MRLFMALGDSEWILRAPTLIASTVTVLIVFVTVKRLWGARAAVVSAALLLLSPLDLWYAQEARQAAIAGTFVAAFMYLVVRHDRLGKALIVVLVPVALYFDYIVIVGVLVLLGIYSYPDRQRPPNQTAEMWMASALGLAIFALFRGAHLWNGFGHLLGGDGAGVWYGRVLGSNPVTSNPAGLCALIVVAGLLVGAILSWAKSGNTPRIIVSGLVLSAYAVILVAPVMDRAYSVKRVLVIGSPVIVTIVAMVLIGLRPPVRRWLLIGLLALGAASMIFTLGLPKDDWRSAVAHINARSGSGDIAWMDNVEWLPTGVYAYYDGKLPVYTDGDPSARVAELSADQDVWLITRRRPQDSIPSLEAEAWFDQHLRLVEEFPVHRMSVRHYTAP